MRQRIGRRAAAFALAFTAGIAAVGAGQSAPVRFDWPAGHGGAGPFARSVAARLTGEQRQDVVVVAGSAAVAWIEPAVGQDHFVLPFGVTVRDVATLPFEQSAAGGDRDELAIAAAEGLLIGGIDEDGVYTRALDRSPAWRNARRLRAADVNGDGLVDLAILRADGCTIAVKRQTASGAFVDAPALGFVATHPVRDFDFAELDGTSPAPELVVDHAAGLDLVRMDGVVLASWPSVRPDLDAFAILRGDAALPTERVLWSTAAVAAPADPTRAFFVADLSGATLQFLTTDPFRTLASGRFDLDDVADAAAMVGPEEQLALLDAQAGATPTFDLAPEDAHVVQLLDPGTGAAPPAVPLVADLGGDGFDDLFVPLATTKEVLVFDGPLSREGESLPVTAVADFVHDGACFETLDASGGLIVYVRAFFPGASAHLADPHWNLESRAFSMLPSGVLDSQPSSACTKPLSTYLVGTADPDVVEIGFECPATISVDEFTLRVVQVDATGKIVSAGPTLIGAFTENADEQLEITQDLADPGWPGFELVGSCGVSGGTRINGFIRIRRLHPKAPPPPPPPPPPPTCKDHVH